MSPSDHKYDVALDSIREKIGDILVPNLHPCSPSWHIMYLSDIDHDTELLERQGYKIWFTCEADGYEVRLAARTERVKPDYEIFFPAEPDRF